MLPVRLLYNAPINGLVHHFASIQYANLNRDESLFGLATGALRAVLRVRKIGIDAVVDMEFLTRFSATLTFATGAKSRVGFHTFFGDGPYRGDLMTHRLFYNFHLHTSEMFEAMVEALTRDPAVLPTFEFTPSASQPVPKFRRSLSDVGER